MAFAQLEMYWSMIAVWLVVLAIYIYIGISALVNYIRRKIKGIMKKKVTPEWAGAYERRVSYAQLLDMWTSDECPHSSLVGCAKLGCIGLPKELYVARMQLEEECDFPPESPIPTYQEATSSSEKKLPQTLHQRRTGHASPVTVESLTREIQKRANRSTAAELKCAESSGLKNLEIGSSETLVLEDSLRYSPQSDSPPPSYKSLQIVD